jgi:hypothetical protein
MAKIVLALGTSHGPLTHLEADQWLERAKDDMLSGALNTIDGRMVSYQELVAERGEPYVRESSVEHLTRQAEQVQRAISRIADELEACAPDLVVVVGDDQGELFGPENMPAVSIFYGKDIATHPWENAERMPAFWKPVLKGCGLDDFHVYEGAPEFSLELIESLIEQHFDVAAAASVPDPAKRGFGHAFGFVVERLYRGRSIPMVPVLLNTYFPPNAPMPGRCYALGRALRKAIEDSPAELRVALIASGGLSHFLCEEALDRSVLDAIARKDEAALAAIPRQAILSGSSEILNWITVAGATEHLEMAWSEYMPVYRTPAGTGIGMAFAAWKDIG